MNKLIKKIVGVWQGADGTLAEVVYDEGGGHAPDNWQAVDALEAPCRKLRVVFELDDQVRIAAPFTEIANILPDRTGVLVVFDENPPTPGHGVEYFSVPDNAAVFNADGSLRFRLKNPCGETGGFWALERIRRSDREWLLGVRACPKNQPTCDHVYVVDGVTSDLSHQMPLWMRY